MGQPAARLGDLTSHGTSLGPGPGCPTVMIAGQPAWRAGSDAHACPLVDGLKPHVGGVVAVGSVTVMIGKNVAPGVIGGVTPGPSGAYVASDLDSKTGAAVAGGDIPVAESHVAAARTLGSDSVDGGESPASSLADSLAGGGPSSDTSVGRTPIAVMDGREPASGNASTSMVASAAALGIRRSRSRTRPASTTAASFSGTQSALRASGITSARTMRSIVPMWPPTWAPPSRPRQHRTR